MPYIRAYLRASTIEQDAARAAAALDQFAADRGLTIAARYVENESGTTLKRPELFRLLADCGPGDVLLIEQVDRLSRLNAADWQRLKGEIDARGVRIVALDLPTSWAFLAAGNADDVQSRILTAINAMLLDMLAAIARKDYDDRRRRQGEGIAKAKAAGLYTGRPENVTRNDRIAEMLDLGMSWQAIIEATGCARGTIAKIAKRGRVALAAD